jgi:hypothetical protein
MKLWKILTIILVTVLSFAILIWYFRISGLVAWVFETLLIVFIANPDRTLQFIASLLTVGRRFSFWFERNKVEKYLEGTIGVTSKKMNEEGVEVLPHGVNIKWVEPTERDAFLKDGKIVVCLSSSYNQARNLARAVMLYVEEDLVRESQVFVETTVMKSAKIVTARKLLMIDKRIDSLKYLNDEFIKPEIEKTPEIAKYMTGMEKMDEQGHLTRILLREFSQLGPRLSYKLVDPQAVRETKMFTDFLQVFEEREREEDVPLSSSGNVIRVALLPVAKLGTDFDPARFVGWARKNFEEKIETLYVLARGTGNITLAEVVEEQIEEESLYKKQASWEYTVLKEVGSAESNAKGSIRSYLCVLTRIG